MDDDVDCDCGKLLLKIRYMKSGALLIAFTEFRDKLEEVEKRMKDALIDSA